MDYNRDRVQKSLIDAGSSCNFCDEIAVFHDGAVIQQGTHEKLLSNESGKYHELWNAQAQYYTEKNA